MTILQSCGLPYTLSEYSLLWVTRARDLSLYKSHIATACGLSHECAILYIEVCIIVCGDVVCPGHLDAA